MGSYFYEIAVLLVILNVLHSCLLSNMLVFFSNLEEKRSGSAVETGSTHNILKNFEILGNITASHIFKALIAEGFSFLPSFITGWYYENFFLPKVKLYFNCAFFFQAYRIFIIYTDWISSYDTLARFQRNNLLNKKDKFWYDPNLDFMSVIAASSKE